ncbi:MAG: TIGR02099 family protein [Gammaproteobacteria bacterium HGW-Gammaproteobacteria-1]|jgi:uncharacterized protein (TIGR02099 family)|nr:MAG: TIGR02099 family protein [Gammaproteobacteria bacterium HGW-Gammaproteobacteria-1]
MEKPSLFRRLRRALWFTTAGLAILAAVLLTLTRMLLPGMEGYRTQVEAMASAALGQPVHIRTMGGRLRGLSPVVVLEDVELLDAAGKHPVAHFREAQVGFDLWLSLRRLQPAMSALTVSGADLTVVRRKDGSLRVQGLAESGGDGDAAEGIGRWLLEQGSLALLESRLHWRDLKTGRSLDIDRVDIELYNSAGQHQLNVEVMLPPGMGRSLHLSLDLEGDILQPGAWRGRGHAQGWGLRPAPWLEEWGPLAGITLREGVFDLQLWGEWGAGRLVQAQGTVEAGGLALRAGDNALDLARVTAAAQWRRGETGWDLHLDDLRLWRQAADTVEPVAAALRRDGDAWDVQVSALRLEDVAAVAPLLPDADLRATVAALQPRGRVRQLRLALAGGALTHAQGTLEQAALAPWRQLPGFSGLSASWVWSGGRGQVLLDSLDTALDLPSLFREPLQFEQLRGTIGLAHDASGWRLDIEGLRIATPDIHASVDAALDLPAGAAPYLDLRGVFWNGRALGVPRYLPAGIMGKEALAWLDTAFRGGSVTRGGVLFHGPLDTFPFDGGEGRFEVDFGVHDAELFFQPGWPSLREVDAQVTFLNRGLVINADSGRMYDSNVSGARVGIADLHHPLLTVQGAARLNGDDAIRLLRDTPLRARLGDYVAMLRLEGESALELDFALPLDSALDQTQPFRLAGAVDLQGNRLWIGDRLSVDAIEGRLAFTDTGMQAEALQARLLDEPATITIRGEGKGNTTRTVIAGRGQMQAAALQRLYPSPLLAAVQGRGGWQGTLAVPHKGSRGGAELRLTSDLHGMALDLPAPLRKAAEERRSLEVVHRFSGPRRGQLQLAYGDGVKALLALDEDGVLRRGGIHFGPGKARLTQRNELLVSGSLRDLDLGRWGEALRGGGKGKLLPLRLEMDELHLVAAGEQDSAPSRWQELPPLDVQIKRFGYGEQQLDQLAFKLRSNRESMQLSELLLTGPALNLSGQARWQLRPRSYSEMKLHLQSPDFGAMLRHLKVASVITRGKADVEAELNWPGTLAEGSLATLGGSAHARIEDGMVDEVEPGAGRLLGLLSLQALPRRLVLDFRDLFQKGLDFTRIEGDVSLGGGNAYTSNLVMDSAAALVRIDGRTGLVARDYDQRVIVVPNLSGTAPVVGTLAFGPQVGALLLLFQRLLKKNVDEAARTEYRVTGPWEQPVIEKVPEKKKEAAAAQDNPLL